MEKRVYIYFYNFSILSAVKFLDKATSVKVVIKMGVEFWTKLKVKANLKTKINLKIWAESILLTSLFGL